MLNNMQICLVTPQPYLASPHFATPRQVSSRHATPRLVTPRLATPRHTTATLFMPRNTSPQSHHGCVTITPHPCHSLATATPQPSQSHALASPQPRHSHATAMPQPRLEILNTPTIRSACPAEPQPQQQVPSSHSMDLRNVNISRAEIGMSLWIRGFYEGISSSAQNFIAHLPTSNACDPCRLESCRQSLMA